MNPYTRIKALEDEVAELQIDFDELIAEFDAVLAITTEVLEKLTPKKKAVMSSNAMKVMKSGAKKGTIVWAPEKKKTRFNGKEFEEVNGSWVMVEPKKKRGRPRKTK